MYCMDAISDYPCFLAHSKNSFIFIRSKFIGKKLLAIVLVESKRTINNSPSWVTKDHPENPLAPLKDH